MTLDLGSLMVLALVVVIQQGPQVHRQGLLFIFSTLCLSIQILRTLVLHRGVNGSNLRVPASLSKNTNYMWPM